MLKPKAATATARTRPLPHVIARIMVVFFMIHVLLNSKCSPWPGLPKLSMLATNSSLQVLITHLMWSHSGHQPKAAEHESGMSMPSSLFQEPGILPPEGEYPPIPD